jgi:hypothetical protein
MAVLLNDMAFMLFRRDPMAPQVHSVVAVWSSRALAQADLDGRTDGANYFIVGLPAAG